MSRPGKGLWHVYIIRTRDGQLYTGITTNVTRRIEEHQSGTGRGAKYLRGRGPLSLVYRRKLEEHGLALRVERRLKQRSKSEKESIVAAGLTRRALLRTLRL